MRSRIITTVTRILLLSIFLFSMEVFGQVHKSDSAPLSTQKTSLAEIAWSQTNGPEGGTLKGIAYDPVRSILYVTSRTGCYARKESNAKWYRIATGSYNSIALNTLGEVFFWNTKLQFIYKYIPPIAVDADLDAVVPVKVGETSFSMLEVIAIVPTTNEVYVGSSVGVHKLVGSVWSPLPVSGGTVPDIISSILFVGTDMLVTGSQSPSGVHTYTISSQTWAPISPAPPVPNGLGALAYDAVRNKIYASDVFHNSGIYSYSLPSGPWSGPLSGTAASKFCAITVNSAGDVLAIGSQEIFRSTDGVNFNPLPGSRYAYAQVDNRPNITTYNSRAYAIVGNGVRQSFSPYSVWTRPDMPLENSVAKSVIASKVTAMFNNPINNYLFAGTLEGEIYRTTNPAIGWDGTAYSQAIPVERGKITSFSHYYNPQKGYARIYAGREDGGVYYSADGGYTWGSFNENPLHRTVYATTVYPPYEFNTACSGKKQLGKVFAGTRTGLFWSHCIDECDLPDADWGTVTDELVVKSTIIGLATGAAPNYPLFALREGSPMIRSLDGGNTWEEFPDVIGLCITTNSYGHVFVSEGNVLFRSIDEGTTWSEIYTPIDVPVAMGCNELDQLFISGEDDNVYGSADNGETWVTVTTGLGAAQALCAGNNGTMMAALDHNGVYQTGGAVDPQTGCIAPASGIVGWWSGDNNMLDLSAYENDGTLFNGNAGYTNPGKFAQTFTFNGGTDYLSVPDAADGSLDFPSREFTIAGWIRHTAIENSGRTIVDKRGFSGWDWTGYHLYSVNGRLYFRIGVGTPTPSSWGTNGFIMSAGVWYHIAVSFDGTSTPKIYINGGAPKVLDNNDLPIAGGIVNSGAFTIGGSQYSTSFQGEIDELQLFNRALSQSEIDAIVQSTAGVCKPAGVTKRSLRVTVPSNPDIIWHVGSTRRIEWISSNVSTVNIDYSTDNGSTWTSIAANESAKIGFYDWLVTNTLSAQALIRISDAQHASLSDASDAPFSIAFKWESQVSNTFMRLNDVDFYGTYHGMAVGDSKTIKYTTNGGQTWLSGYAPSGAHKNLMGVNAWAGIAVGGPDNVLYLSPSNLQFPWSSINATTLSSVYVKDVTTSNGAKVYIVGNGGAIFYNDNQSTNTWVQQAAGLTTQNLNGVDFLKHTNKGWAVGNSGTILHTTNGTNWSILPTSTAANLQDVSFVDENNGWAVGGDGTILATDDGGSTWTSQASGTSRKLNSVSFISTNLGYAVGELGTILKYVAPTAIAASNQRRKSTVNTGQWIEVPSSDTSDLFAVSFVGGTTGAIVGDSGATITYTPTAEDSAFLAVSVSLSSRWNMLSLPVTVEDDRVGAIFPGAISNAFSYNSGSGYSAETTMTNRRGYWVKISEGSTQNIVGEARTADTISVSDGWNMIGAISSSVDVSTVITDPPGIITSQFYGYNSGYIATTTIESGKGFWVKVSHDGRLIFASPPATEGGRIFPKPVILPAQLNKLHIKDREGNEQTLYFGSNKSEATPLSLYDLPPIAPDGIFDVRFASHRIAELYDEDDKDVRQFPVLVNSVSYPLIITLELAGGNESRIFFDGKLMRNGQSITVDDKRLTTLMLSVGPGATVPRTFSLEQNYPNPFNPVTTLQFTLPSKATVTLIVFNLLGQKVATLFENQQLDAGTHRKSFDAGYLASGVYFYRISAQSEVTTFNDVKKMLLIK